MPATKVKSRVLFRIIQQFRLTNFLLRIPSFSEASTDSFSNADDLSLNFVMSDSSRTLASCSACNSFLIASISVTLFDRSSSHFCQVLKKIHKAYFMRWNKLDERNWFFLGFIVSTKTNARFVELSKNLSMGSSPNFASNIKSISGE